MCQFYSWFSIFITKYLDLILNSLVVFILGAAYSYIELLQISTKLNQVWKINWGKVYILGNGLIGIVALFATFQGEVLDKFLWGKLLIAGTSGLALLRVVSINLKEKGVEDRSYTIIQVLQKRIYSEFDRSRSSIDLPRLKRIMEPFDNHLYISENLPLLMSNLMRTLTPEEVKSMKEECEKIKEIKEGNEKIKCINLGAIIARYIGIELLENTLDVLSMDLKSTLQTPSTQKDGKNIDDYLKEFS